MSWDDMALASALSKVVVSWLESPTPLTIWSRGCLYLARQEDQRATSTKYPHYPPDRRPGFRFDALHSGRKKLAAALTPTAAKACFSSNLALSASL